MGGRRAGSSRMLDPRTQAALFLRDRAKGDDFSTCVWCGQPAGRPRNDSDMNDLDASIDHVNGLFGAEENGPSNLVVSHRCCNFERYQAALEENEERWKKHLRSHGATIRQAEARLRRAISRPLRKGTPEHLALTQELSGKRILYLNEKNRRYRKKMLAIEAIKSAEAGEPTTPARFVAAEQEGWVTGSPESPKMTSSGRLELMAQRLNKPAVPF